MVDGRGAVVFIHDAWQRAGSWRGWRQLFDRNGYDSLPVLWPGESETAQESAPNGSRSTFTEISRAVAEQIVGWGVSGPILIGHGTGGSIAQRLLRQTGASAAVSLAAGSCCRASSRWYRRARSSQIPGEAEFHAWFANTLGGPESDLLRSQTVAPFAVNPGRFLERTVAWSRSPLRRPPLLLIGGGNDRIAPEQQMLRVFADYRRRHPAAVTEFHVLPDRAHSLTIDDGWPEVANYVLDWLTRQNL